VGRSLWGQRLRLAGRSPAEVWWIVRRSKLRAALAILVRAPKPIRRFVGRLCRRLGSVRGWRTKPGRSEVLAIIGALLLDRPDDGIPRALVLGQSDDPTTAVRAARLLVAFRRFTDAWAVLERPIARTDDVRFARAEVGRAAGRLRVAEDELVALLASRPGNGVATRLLREVRSALRVLQPDWRPALPPGGPVTPTRGRILHLVTNSLPDRAAGYTYRTVDVVRSQRDAGLDPLIATRAGFPGSLGRASAATEETIEGIEYHRIDPGLAVTTPPDTIVERSASGLAKLVERHRPAALQPASNHPNAQAALAVGRRFSIPVVYEVRGFQEESWLARMGDEARDADLYLGAKAVETACMLEADAIVTLSETMAQDICARGVKADRVVVIPNAVDLGRFQPREDRGLRASLGIKPEEVVLGYVTTLWPYEGVEVLLRATRRLIDRGRAVRALVVGDGESMPSIRAESARLGLNDGPALLVGRVPRESILDYYAAIDVFVVPRRDEAVTRLVTPLKPFEAMAMERAVVVSGVDALREMIVPGETGLVFRPDDDADLAETVDPLVTDAGARKQLGRRAREWVGEHRTWTQNGVRYRRLFERLGVA
jgi:glycosyltransferase involved in cell wall biosynthesis